MARNTRTDLWLGLAFVAVTVVTIQFMRPESGSGIANIEPAAGEEVIQSIDKAFPVSVPDAPAAVEEPEAIPVDKDGNILFPDNN